MANHFLTRLIIRVFRRISRNLLLMGYRILFKTECKNFLHPFPKYDMISVVQTHMPLWRNWQTHLTQNQADNTVPVRVRPVAYKKLQGISLELFLFPFIFAAFLIFYLLHLAGILFLIRTLQLSGKSGLPYHAQGIVDALSACRQIS